MIDRTADSASSVTLVERIARSVRDRVAEGTLVAGSKLLSVRRAAETYGVSKSTVVEAYDRLVAEGVITSRPGSGFTVAGRPAPVSPAEVGPKRDRAIDPFWVSRQALEAEGARTVPGCGWVPATWLPQDAVRKALRSASRLPSVEIADYATPLGAPALRAVIARRIAAQGLEISSDAIMLTESGTQAIDLVCRLMIERGDTVLVDDPCYFNFQALLRVHRAKVIGVPMTPSGPDPAAFAALVAEHRPRLYLTNSGIHNPTGASLAPATAHRVLKVAEAFDLTIVEDDIFADFETEPSPRLATLDGLERVVRVGSFSKTLSASLRAGYVAARPDWIEALVDLKIATSFGGGRLAADVVASVLQDGAYRRHLGALHAKLAGARERVGRNLRQIGIEPWIEPAGGLFLWCQLPDGLDSAEIAAKALKEGIVLAPGNVFSPSETAGRFLRFNVAQSLDSKLYKVLAGVIGAKARPREPSKIEQMSLFAADRPKPKRGRRKDGGPVEPGTPEGAATAAAGSADEEALAD